MHQLCFGLPVLHWAISEAFVPWGRIPTFCFKKPRGEVQTPQSVAALFTVGLVCTVLGPAGILPDLFMRHFRLPRRSQVLQEHVPHVLLEAAPLQLGSLLRCLNQLPRGLALLCYMAKSQRIRVCADG